MLISWDPPTAAVVLIDAALVATAITLIAVIAHTAHTPPADAGK